MDPAVESNCIRQDLDSLASSRWCFIAGEADQVRIGVQLIVCLFTVLIVVLSTGCKSAYLNAGSYHSSIVALSTNSPERALAVFPGGEKGTFITDMEKAYLSILQGKPEIDVLRKRAAALDNRMRYEVSKEIKAFFYAETPEGYYPSEHEIMWMHLLLGWGYAMREDRTSALIEARRVGWLLDSPWSEEGHFDDATLRILCASLWSLCGEWDEAAVDLRAAAGLDDSLGWAKALADSGQPRNLLFVLGGVGPEAYWDPEKSFNLLRGLRHVGFRPQGLRSDIRLAGVNSNEVTVARSPDSSRWYERHWQRNNAIRELVEDSHYGNTMLLSSARSAGKVGLATVWGVSAGAAMFAAGAGILYLSAETGGGGDGTGDAALFGILLMVAGPMYTYKVIRSTAADAVDEFKQDLDASGTYRFVRFLPEYVWVGWSDDDIREPFSIKIAGQDALPVQPFARSGNGVLLVFHPDAQPATGGNAAGPASTRSVYHVTR